MNIGIIGCGYAGKAIAALWRERGAFVTATTRSEYNLPLIKPYCDQTLIFSPDSPSSLSQLLEENSVIYICVAPKGNQSYEQTYLHTAQTIRKILATTQNHGTIVYLSSTSVYAESEGRWVDEGSLLDEKDPHAHILIETENTFLHCKNEDWKVVVLRLGEIYGPGRDLQQKAQYYLAHPGAFFGENYTNMVHIDDIAHAAHYVINSSLTGIFNLADDEHPIRKELFAKICSTYNIPSITWGNVKNPIHGKNKRVSNDKITRTGYQLVHPQREF